MKEFLPLLVRTKLFDGLNEEDILSALSCLSPTIKTLDKGSFVYSEGERVSHVGIILSGEIEVQKTDYEGNTNIISKLYPADMIAASACYSTEKRAPFDVRSACESSILNLDIGKIIRPCCNGCVYHISLIKNMLGVISDKNMQLTYKIDLLTKRSIKERLLAYLHSQSKRAGSKRFSVPLSRRQMADFLSINRSALSRELSVLQEEGILQFDKNNFVLK